MKTNHQKWDTNIFKLINNKGKKQVLSENFKGYLLLTPYKKK